MILCCGEALIDMLPGRTAQGAQAFVPHPGGAVFNTAIALGRLGSGVALLSAIGDDMFGRQLERALLESGVAREYLMRVQRPTTLAFVQLEEGQASYSFYDENSAGRMLSESEMPTLRDDISALFFGGISLACEPGAEAYAALLEKAGHGRAVMIDPNIRPDFIAEPERYRKRLGRMLARADILKLSDEDLDWLDPSPRPQEQKIAALLDQGPALVILTRGKGGASAYSRAGWQRHVPAQTADVIDTVGAGDTFNAGVLAWLSKHGLLHRPAIEALDPQACSAALRQGARVAAVTVSRAGANPPWASEL